MPPLHGVKGPVNLARSLSLALIDKKRFPRAGTWRHRATPLLSLPTHPMHRLMSAGRPLARLSYIAPTASGMRFPPRRLPHNLDAGGVPSCSRVCSPSPRMLGPSGCGEELFGFPRPALAPAVVWVDVPGSMPERPCPFTGVGCQGQRHGAVRRNRGCSSRACPPRQVVDAPHAPAIRWRGRSRHTVRHHICYNADGRVIYLSPAMAVRRDPMPVHAVAMLRMTGLPTPVRRAMMPCAAMPTRRSAQPRPGSAQVRNPEHCQCAIPPCKAVPRRVVAIPMLYCARQCSAAPPRVHALRSLACTRPVETVPRLSTADPSIAPPMRRIATLRYRRPCWAAQSCTYAVPYGSARFHAGTLRFRALPCRNSTGPLDARPCPRYGQHCGSMRCSAVPRPCASLPPTPSPSAAMPIGTLPRRRRT